MKFNCFTGSVLGFLALGGVAWGCSSQSTSCTANENCGPYDGSAGTSSGGASGAPAGGSAGASGDSAASGSSGTSSGGKGGEGGVAGESGAAGAGVAPCDTKSTPTAESCLVSDEYGVFVAPNGDDNNAGSMGAPVATIMQAINLAQSAGKFVIACDGSYDEQVNISASVALYGGFTCPDSSHAAWQSEAGGKAKVTPSVRGIALSIKSSTAPVWINDFEFDAQDGVNPGESSVAALLNGATNVTMTRVKLVAGRGVAGASGTLASVTFAPQSDLNGHAATGDTGGTFNQRMCPAGGTTIGGVGGGGGPALSGGGPGAPALGGGAAGALGAGCGASPSGSGGDGTNASAQSAAAGAAKLGNLTPTGWNGTPGSDGTPGTPGQGGGGGTGAASGGGGGGGGAGGCGGAGGTGGKAGGSSIALALLDSNITLSASELVAVGAGKGGDGAAGQAGQSPGGSGGVGVPDGCPGGKGGSGGAGGAGGGGAGGVSVGIAYQGSSNPPAPDAATVINVGKAGDPGIGGAGTNNGVAGEAQAVLGVL